MAMKVLVKQEPKPKAAEPPAFVPVAVLAEPIASWLLPTVHWVAPPPKTAASLDHPASHHDHLDQLRSER